MKTIRHKLLIGLLGGALVCTLAAGVAMYAKLLEEANELFDYQLRQFAATVSERDALRQTVHAKGDPEENILVEIWDDRGALRFSSSQTPAPVLAQVARPGYSITVAHGERWRVYAERRDGGMVQVAQAVAGRERLAAGIALRSLLPFLLVMPILGLIIYVVVGRSLLPLSRLAQAVGRRSPQALQPVPPEGQPPELAPVVSALNDLLRQLDHALASQRAFVADAAHELRSPLTALKLQLQLAERAPDDSQRQLAFSKLHERLDRSTHLVQQLLASARYEFSPAGRRVAPLDLFDLAQRGVADRYADACVRGVDLGVVGQAGIALVAGDFDDLLVLLNNLLDNALRHAGAGGQVDVEVALDGGCPAIRVTDTGPGIPQHERARVFDRFYRGEGGGGWGSGLGLSIVRGVAATHAAEVQLGDGPDGKGLRVAVRFPSPPALA
ncbi:MAG TPA: ATP-binding protein [Telluria sp.]|nr:ATP-binding protein [Telluria sp.]